MTREVEVRVKRLGKTIATIYRPLQELEGTPAISFRGKLWPLVDGTVEVGIPEVIEQVEAGSETGDPSPVAAPPVSAQAQENRAADDASWQDPITEPPSARLIVDAGPGTGKTHAACARVASMVSSGIPASRISLISFTRTAVVEIRNRIARALEDRAEAASVRIVTLDAFAWAVQSGFTKDARLTGSYEHNISAAHRLVLDDLDVRDDLTRIEHLIIDEAQDIVGARADLVLAMVDALSPESGITVFADRAQAIYGFAELNREGGCTNFLDELVKRGFQQRRLTKVHRTTDPNLLTIFTDLRRTVLDSRRPDIERHVQSEIRRLAHEDVGDIGKLDLSAVPNDSLVLMRNRLDVLIASSHAGTIPHRLRLSNMPICVRAWVAHLLWDYVQRRISRDEFERRWHERRIQAPISCTEAWSRCVEVAGESAVVVDLHILRTVLARANPPMIFCTPEFGTSGPILGTIHASKGREAPTVYLYLQERFAVDATGEESRVMLVGASRPRDRLLVGTTSGLSGRTTNERLWRSTGRSMQVEVGKPCDIEPPGLVGRPFFSRQDDAMAAQEAWTSQSLRHCMTLRAQENAGWQYALNDGAQRLAGLSERFRSDINLISWKLQKRIGWLGSCRSIGIRSMVVAPDSNYTESMLEPWRSSGFLIAPLLCSLSTAIPRPR